MKFGIISAKDVKKAGELASDIKKFLVGGGQEVVEDLKDAELIITLGGDGTLLHAACEHIALGVPFVGINVGTLGFLTATEADEWQEAIEDIISGKYFVSERMTIEASIEANPKSQITNTKYRALNEVVVKGMYRVVNLEITVNGQKFLNTSGDGVIVATQTGSTAYSLSAGGPIVDPEVDSLLITPVNAHGLPVPSVVLSPNDEILVKVIRGNDISLVIDGQEHIKISQSQSVRVERGQYRVKLVYFEKDQFLKSLNAKFGLASRSAAG
ncbi:MAG: NAD(+)/NADH kinase [Candidatus Curtissbacteria bacterium]|nr:NAD(+)/NADH kinase [Candidatus Curtissbacteria bacterium]